MSTIPISLLLSACSDYGQAPVEGGDQFDVPEQASVDVLLVVDNSSSMEPYQAMLASGFEGFITPFLDGLIDYHIAITTTDDGIARLGFSASGSGWNYSAVSGTSKELRARERWRRSRCHASAELPSEAPPRRRPRDCPSWFSANAG